MSTYLRILLFLESDKATDKGAGIVGVWHESWAMEESTVSLLQVPADLMSASKTNSQLHGVRSKLLTNKTWV